MLTLCFWWQVLLLALYCATTEASPTGELTFLKELMQSLKGCLKQLNHRLSLGLPKDWTDNVTGSDYCKFTGTSCGRCGKLAIIFRCCLQKWIECLVPQRAAAEQCGPVWHSPIARYVSYILLAFVHFLGWADAPRLTVLNMSNNHISGPLPAELFGASDWTHLDYLISHHLGLTNGQIFLGDNNLNSTLPDILPQFGGTSLRKLHLQGNRYEKSKEIDYCSLTLSFTGCIPKSWTRVNSICVFGEDCKGICLVRFL